MLRFCFVSLNFVVKWCDMLHFFSILTSMIVLCVDIFMLIWAKCGIYAIKAWKQGLNVLVSIHRFIQFQEVFVLNFLTENSIKCSIMAKNHIYRSNYIILPKYLLESPIHFWNKLPMLLDTATLQSNNYKPQHSKNFISAPRIFVKNNGICE